MPSTLAVSAYWTGSLQVLGKRTHRLPSGTVTTTLTRLSRTWHVDNPASGHYEKTPWSWVDVAPGLRKTAVLAGELPSRRLGVLDPATRKVLSRIEPPQGAAHVKWSPDGRFILATTCNRHPDDLEIRSAHSIAGTDATSTRTGYSIVDAATLQVGCSTSSPGPTTTG